LYVAEFQFRYNNRLNADIFAEVIKGCQHDTRHIFQLLYARLTATPMAIDHALSSAKNPRTVRVFMWNVSEPLANLLFDVSGALLILGAVLVAIGTYGTIKMGGAKEYFANERISENERVAAGAMKDAAHANERAAGLEKEAANARLETERLKAQFAWRAFSPEQAKALEQDLAAHPGIVNVMYVSGDPEANNLAIQIGNIFSAAKWQVGMLGSTFNGAAIFGLWVPDTPAKDTSAIRSAFTAHEIGYSTAALPSSGMMGFGGTIPNAATVFVGSKKPN
jgi:hypothetical protein